MRQNLKNARLDNQYTQAELAKKLGISERYYQAIESGNRKGDVYIWEKLILILEEPLTYLLKRVDKRQKPDGNLAK